MYECDKEILVMVKKLIAFRCPTDLLAEMDATCEKYALDRTAYITMALRHMEDMIEGSHAEPEDSKGRKADVNTTDEPAS